MRDNSALAIVRHIDAEGIKKDAQISAIIQVIKNNELKKLTWTDLENLIKWTVENTYFISEEMEKAMFKANCTTDVQEACLQGWNAAWDVAFKLGYRAGFDEGTEAVANINVENAKGEQA